jgi:hypothetical protein
MLDDSMGKGGRIIINISLLFEAECTVDIPRKYCQGGSYKTT